MKYPNVHKWLMVQENFGLAANTIVAYERAITDYLSFCCDQRIEIDQATIEHISLYIRKLSTRRLIRRSGDGLQDYGLANATLQQRLTVIRLYYDFLVEEGIRLTNPVSRGRKRKGFQSSTRGLIPRYKKLPWIPDEASWQRLLAVVRLESLRNRLMFAIAYDAGLRREEL